MKIEEKEISKVSIQVAAFTTYVQIIYIVTEYGNLSQISVQKGILTDLDIVVSDNTIPSECQSSVVDVGSGSNFTCTLQSHSPSLITYKLCCWGNNKFGQTDIPTHFQ